MITLKQLRTFGFHLSNYDMPSGEYHVEKKGTSQYDVYGYWATIRLVGKSIEFNGQRFTKLDDLISAMETYNNGLFRSPVYSHPSYRLGINDDRLIQDVLYENGWKHPKGDWGWNDYDAYELTTKVFGTSFRLYIYLTRKDDSREYLVHYKLDEPVLSPVFVARCIGAESVLSIVNQIKTYILQETIKQLVAYYEKEISVDQSKVEIKDEYALKVDMYFRQWIGLKTWNDITKDNETAFDEPLIPYRVSEFSKKVQSFVGASDVLTRADMQQLEAENCYFLIN